MKKILPLFLICTVLSSLTSAQSPFAPERGTRAVESMEREFVLEDLKNGRAQAELAIEEKARAQMLENQFVRKMNRIAELWRGIVEEYNAKRAFNIRTARELSKAFRELEHSEVWPKPVREK